MVKLGLFASIATIAGSLALASFGHSSAQAGDTPCVTKTFHTVLVKEACAKGGQKAAKDVMKKWNKDKKIKSCNQCHSKMAPSYELKADGLTQYTKLGGK